MSAESVIMIHTVDVEKCHTNKIQLHVGAGGNSQRIFEVSRTHSLGTIKISDKF